MRHKSLFLVFAALLICSSNAFAQWVRINGKGGSCANAIAGNGSNVLSATNNGLLLSSDNGATWNLFDTGLNEMNITSLFSVNNVLLAGTESANEEQAFIYRWNDSSNEWQERSSVNTFYGPLYEFCTLGPILFAITDRALAVSTDAGLTWNINDSSFINFGVSSIAALSTQLFVGTNDGVLTSLDFGVTWIPPSTTYLGKNDISSLATMGSILFAGNSNEYDTVSNGIYRSTNFGESWTLAYTSPLVSVLSFCVSGSEIFAATDIGVLMSSDSGKTWQIRNTGLTNLKVQTLNMIGTTLFAGTQGDGVFRSTDSGQTWKPGNTGIAGIFPTTLYHTNDGIFVNTISNSNTRYTGGLLRSEDEGSSWQSCNPGSTNLVGAFSEIDSMYIVLAGNPPIASGNSSGYSHIYFSTDEGSSWTKDNSSDSQYSIFSFSAFGTNILATTQDDGVWLSSDSGQTWMRVDSNLGRWATEYDLVALGDTLFAATYSGVFRSTDTAKEWEQINNGLTDTDILCLTVIGENLFAADVNGHGIFRSTDRGETWTSANSGLPDAPWVYSFAVSGVNLFAALQGGVYLSTDLGNSWTNVSDGWNFGTQLAQYLTIDDNYLFVTLSTNIDCSVWRRPLSDMIPQSSVAATSATIPSFQSYPNPFSLSTTISITAPESGYSEISITNILGVEVDKIYSGELDAGTHSFEWNPSNLPNGVYECQVRMNGQNRSIPLVLSR